MPGKFLKPEQLQAYFDRGVRRVIVAAPVKDPAALNIAKIRCKQARIA